jgi:hypothetical protein
LTTFIDHRPYPGRASPYERPTTDQINPDGLSIHPHGRGRSHTREDDRRPTIAKKVLDDPPAKTEKTKVESGGLGPLHPNTSRRIAVYRDLHAGGYLRQASQNLLLNLYSLVKERRNGKPSRNGHDRFEADHALIVE